MTMVFDIAQLCSITMYNLVATYLKILYQKTNPTLKLRAGTRHDTKVLRKSVDPASQCNA